MILYALWFQYWLIGQNMNHLLGEYPQDIFRVRVSHFGFYTVLLTFCMYCIPLHRDLEPVNAALCPRRH